MRNLLVLFALLAIAGQSAMAQTPKVELFTGLSYGQFNPGGLLTDSDSGLGRHFAMPGLEATGEFNFTSHLGFVADVSGYGGTGDVDSLADHLRAIQMHVSRKLVDYVVANRQPVWPKVARRYRAEGAEPVVIDLPEIQKLGCRVFLDNLLDERDVIRHNHKRLAKLLLEKFCCPPRKRSTPIISSRATSDRAASRRPSSKF